MAGAVRWPRALLPGLGSIVQDTGAALTQGVGDGIGDLTSGLGAVTSGIGAVTSGIGSITSDIGSGVSTILSPILPTLTSSSTTTTTTSSTTDTSTSSSTSLTSSSSSSSSSSISSSSSVSTTAASPTTPLADNGQHTTVTAIVSTTDTGSSTPTSSAAPTSFLQNKPLAGAVFGIIGVLVLVAVFLLATFAMRRRRRRKLTEEAVSFEPSEPHYEDGEKGRTSTGSDSSMNRPATVPANPVYYPAVQSYGQQQQYGYYPQLGNGAPQRMASHNPPAPPFGSEGRNSPALKIANP